MTVKHSHPLYTSEDIRQNELQRIFNELFPTIKRSNPNPIERREASRPDRKSV